MFKLIIFLILTTSCIGTTYANYSTEELNRDVNTENPTVDLIFHIIEKSGVTWESLQNQIMFAKEAFIEAGVQLYVKRVEMIKISPEAETIVGVKPSVDSIYLDNSLGPYKSIEQKKNIVPEETVKFLSSIIKDNLMNENIIHILVGGRTLYSFYQKIDSGWRLSTIPTGGFSFPAYILQNRIPRHLRGIITLSHSARESTLAHELAHKLINVTHEVKDVCPKFTGTLVPGLLSYSGQSEIFEGPGGRWHKERLHRSPFIYKLVTGVRYQNSDYIEGGIYSDPLYGDFVVTPPCAE